MAQGCSATSFLLCVQHHFGWAPTRLNCIYCLLSSLETVGKLSSSLGRQFLETDLVLNFKVISTFGFVTPYCCLTDMSVRKQLHGHDIIDHWDRNCASYLSSWFICARALWTTHHLQKCLVLLNHQYKLSLT